MSASSPLSTQFIEQLQAELVAHMSQHEKRLLHSLGVAICAEELAKIYEQDPASARVAGLLHDWDKYLKSDELISRANSYGIDMGAPLEKVVPLLHGPLAAIELKEKYPQLDDSIFQAISRHTTAAIDMSELDMILYVADIIEPGRPPFEGLEELRNSVGNIELEELFFAALRHTISYVIDTGRYLLPSSIEIYNYYAERRHSF